MMVDFLLLFFKFHYAISIGYILPEKLDPNVQVKTLTGFIQGSQETTIHGTKYFRYVGIPYARPPINNLRFRKPQPVSKWSSVLDATIAGPCCASINLTEITKLRFGITGEENCLYLNVFTPKEPRKTVFKNPLAVMMYIHGGGFLNGCNNDYEPDFLIENDVILVVPNYRLSIFGYLSTEDMECSGNWAIKDLIAALNWIKNNIRQFGGDPDRVTIFGQSAGAANINTILLSPMAKGLIHRAILMSGSSLSFWAYQTNPRKIAFDVGIASGIETNSTKILIQELRKIDSEHLLKSQIPTLLANFLTVLTNGLPFTPTIEPLHEEAVWASDYSYYLLERGEFNRVPIMAGVTNMEMLTFKAVIDLLKPFISFLDMSPGQFVRMTEDIKNKTIVGNKIKTKFFASRSFGEATEEELLKVMSDEAYWRPMRKMSSLIAKFCPIYFYQFSYEGQVGLNLNGLFSGITQRKIKGVGHTEDLFYLFHNNGYKRNEKDMEMTKKLTKIYTNFAKSGNPTINIDPLLDNVTWPLISEKKFPYLSMGEVFEIVETNFNEENFQFWEDLFETYGQKPYKVY